MAVSAPATTGNPQTSTGSNSTGTPGKAIDTAMTGANGTPSTGPAVVGNKQGGVETKTLVEGHEAPKMGEVKEVISHIEPTVPEPAAPSAAFGVDPAHPSVDTYASEDAASLAPGIHVDLSAVARPVGVITHDPPPFNRIDGATPGIKPGTPDEAMTKAQDDALDELEPQ